MKKNYLFALAMAAAFASCSDDNDSVNVPENGDVKGYMSFNVSLPSMSTTRAANDNFVEGDDAEYAVNDITICLLNDAGTILQVANPTTTWTDNGDANVARVSATIVVKTETSPTKALVVLNHNSQLTLTKDATWSNTLLTGKTAKSFIKSNDGTTNVGTGITMTNAAIVAGDAIQDLTPITSANLANTLAEAQKNPVNVYVERVVAKVSMASNATTEFSENIPAGLARITLNKWELDITNKSTYPLRNTTGNDWLTTGSYISTKVTDGTNRMIGASNTTPQRVYWAIDGNYTKPTGGYTNGFDNATSIDNAMTAVDYCLENTFDIANQTQDQTTRVVFKATITPSETSGYTAGENFFTLEESSDIWTITSLATQISTYATEAGVTVGTQNNTALSGITTAGVVTIDAALLNSLLGVTTVTEEHASAISAKLGKVNCYVGGVAYYVARIKHFGDDLTPWATTDDTYGNNSQNWLGRYGVVRNNWYELNVTGIKKLGTPTIPTPEDIPDDEKEEYMVYEINILSWAKRSQDVEL